MVATRTLLLFGALAATPWLAGCRPSPPPSPSTDAGPSPSGSSGSGWPSSLDGRLAKGPPMGALVFLDRGKMDINAGILVAGAGAEDFAHHVYRRTSRADLSGLDDGTPSGDASVFYVPLMLGDIRGWHTRLHLYAIGTDERLADAIADWTPQAKAIVIVEKQPGDSDAVARVVAGKLAGSWAPVALIGSEALFHRWLELGGPTPVFSGPAGSDSVFPALKSVAKEILTALRGDGH